MSIAERYRLSPQAARAESNRAVWRGPSAGKNVIVAGTPSRHDGTNFRTNMVTLAQYEDTLAGSGNPLGLSATWACVNLIAGTIASLPVMVYRQTGGVKEVARDHPLFYLLHDSPNAEQTALDFWEFQSAGVELRGNAYAEISRRGDGTVVALTPVRPDIVRPHRRERDGALQYDWYEGGKRVVRDAASMLHIRGPMGNPLGGVSVLSMASGTFAGALSAEGAARATFANGMRPSGMLSLEDSLKAEQRAELETLLQEKFAGAMNSGRPMVLDRGMTWASINITPEDAQMLDSRKFSGEEICRLFGVPPAMVGFGDKASNWGTGKEVDVLGFQKFTLRRRLKRIEQALQKQLLTAADRVRGVTIEFNLEGLLRGDSAGRAGFYNTMTAMGAMTINEVRALENLPPVPGGDVPRMQMQNVPIGQTGQENQ